MKISIKMADASSMSDSRLKDDVMRRVRAIHTMRKSWPLVLEGAITGVSVATLAMIVSIPHIISNTLHQTGWGACIFYLSVAFLHTTFAAQVAVVLTIAAGSWLVKDATQNIRMHMTYIKI